MPQRSPCYNCEFQSYCKKEPPCVDCDLAFQYSISLLTPYERELLHNTIPKRKYIMSPNKMVIGQAKKGKKGSIPILENLKNLAKNNGFQNHHDWLKHVYKNRIMSVNKIAESICSSAPFVYSQMKEAGVKFKKPGKESQDYWNNKEK